MENIENELRIIQDNPNDPHHFWKIKFQKKEFFNAQHFVIFLKPELLSLNKDVQIDKIINFIFAQLKIWEIQTGAIRILSGQYLREHSIIANNYGILNKISNEGYNYCSANSQKKLWEFFPETQKNAVKIFGGHQFLNLHDNFSPLTLSEITDNIGTQKLGSGTYAVKITLNDDIYILLNSFHPYQLDALTKLGSAVMAIECFSTKPWSEIRKNFIGYIDPMLASKGSIRRHLFDNKESYNLQLINKAFNGVHISPGPIEGMHQVIRFFSDHQHNQTLSPLDTIFGNFLSQEGFSKKFIKKLENNFSSSLIANDMPIFDLTEDSDNLNACNLLKEYRELSEDQMDFLIK